MKCGEGGVTEQHRTQFRSYIKTLYQSSEEARLALGAAADHGPIIIGTSLDSAEPAFSGRDASSIYIGIDLDRPVSFINTTGSLVVSPPELTLIHEMAHASLLLSDPPDSDALENGADFDFDGNTVRFQNDVARDLGMLDKIQVSYESVISFSDPRYFQFPAGDSLTQGEAIEIARLGYVDGDFIDLK